MKRTIFTFLVLTFAFINLSSQTVVYVASGASGDGTSWTSALGTIQGGIDAANALDPKGEVWVKAGTYTVSVTVFMREGVNVYGGFAGTENARTGRAMGSSDKPWDFVNQTIIDGGGAVRAIESRANFTVETILDGVTLTNGNGVSTSTSGTGGGIIIRPGFKVQKCIIKNNTTNAGGGGGVSMTGGSLAGSYIYKNTQTTNANGGGGIHVNTASGFETIIDNCTFEGNSSTIRGGALNVQGTGMTKMSGLVIFNNLADGKAGGAIYQNSANNSMINSLVFNNTGVSAIYLKGSILNSTIVNNAGGVYLAETSAALEFSNNIIWGCATDASGTTATSLTGAANANAVVHNNATYNPGPADKSWKTADNILFSSNNSNGDVENPAEGTVGSGPKFLKVTKFKGIAAADEEILQLDSADWRIKGFSPCVNVGKTLSNVTSDIRGVARPEGSAYDMGAYEYVETDEPTGLARNSFVYSVYTKENQIIISGFEKAVRVSIYNLSGQTVFNANVNNTHVSVPVYKGIYLVKVDNSAKKVLVY